MKVLLLKIWRGFPYWLQMFLARLIRPAYRVAVAAIIFDERRRILLCEHTYRKKFPWGIPAGNLEFGEKPEDAIVRELFEETGLEICVQRMLMAVSAKEDHHISLIYLCKIVSGSFRPSSEISKVDFFETNKLPRLMPTERALLERIETELKIEK